jgi:WD40 repeat protein
VSFSPDGTTLAAAGSGVELIDVRTGVSRAVLRRGAVGSNRAASFSPDGQFLLTLGPFDTRPENISVWNVESGELAMVLTGHRDFITGLAISPDGTRIASVDFAQNLILWDARTGMSAGTLKTFQQAQSLLFDNTGSTLISGENNGYIELWNIQDWDAPRRLHTQTDEISSLRMRPDGKMLASASIDGTIALWDVRDWKPIKKLDDGAVRRNTMIEFSPDGDSIYAGDAATVSSWDVSSGSRLQVVDDYAGVVTALAFSEQGGWLATSHDDGMVRLWNLNKEGPPVHLKAPGLQAEGVAFDPTGELLFVGGLYQIASVDTATGKPAAMGNLIPATANLEDLFIAHHLAYDRTWHRIASADRNGRVTIWNASSRERVAAVEDEVNNDSSSRGLQYSPDGKWLLTAGLDSLHLRNSQSGQIVKNIPTEQVIDIAFSPNSETVAFSEITRIVLWNIALESPKVVLQNSRMLRNIAYNKDGSLLASNVNDGRDKTITLWDTATGASIVTLSDLHARSEVFAFSTDGTKFAAGSNDGTITFWTVAP